MTNTPQQIRARCENLFVLRGKDCVCFSRFLQSTKIIFYGCLVDLKSRITNGKAREQRAKRSLKNALPFCVFPMSSGKGLPTNCGISPPENKFDSSNFFPGEEMDPFAVSASIYRHRTQITTLDCSRNPHNSVGLARPTGILPQVAAVSVSETRGWH